MRVDGIRVAGMLLGAALLGCGSDDEGPRVAYVTLSGVPCMDGAVACGDDCAQLSSSVEHCGACGNACPVGSICDVGSCRASSEGCSGALELCDRDCVDLQTTDAHCGACEAACPADADCAAGACVCPGLLTACGDSCVDTASDAQNCGACGQACVDAQTCESGSCQCPLGTLLCNVSTLTLADGAVSGASVAKACADIQNDGQNCGACGVVCTGGQVCDQGACKCPAGQTSCDGTCVDTQTSLANCGSCGNACSDGHVCAAGSCVCPEGQTSCNGVCVDTQADAQNCGMCGTSCAFGQGCAEGSCVSGALGDDGCQGLASDLSISEVAAYQTVKVTLARDGQSVEAQPSMVAQRRTLFRVFVETGDGWVPRQLSGRLFLQNGEAISTHYSDVLPIEASSEDDDRASTFEFRIEPEQITPETRYAVEVVECGTPVVAAAPAANERPRFPATDAAELSAVDTGRLRVHLVPMRSNGLLPDTSDTVLQLFEAAFLDTYPVGEVELSVGEPFDIQNPLDWNGNLDRLRALRQQEAPDPAVYYYGMLKPADTLEEFCGQGCVAGVGFIAQPPLNQFPRASMGLSFGDVTSAFTMLHEVGHNHGRNHAPCAPGGQIAGVDPNYPNQTMYLNLLTLIESSDPSGTGKVGSFLAFFVNKNYRPQTPPWVR